MSLRLRAGVGLFTLLAAVTTVVPVHPQTRSLPDAPGTWKPWKPFFAEATARKSSAATPVLVKAFETELIALNAILRRASGVASPVGFSVETWGNLGAYDVSASAPGQPSGAAMPLSGALTFGAFPIFEYVRGGKTIREDTGETALLSFRVNTLARGTIDSGHVDEWGSVDTDAYLQPLPQGEIAGIPRYGDGLVVARDPASLWTPLPLRGALNLTLEARKAVVAESQQSVDAFTEQLAQVRDPARRAARLKDAQEAAATLPDPQGFMKQIEESLRIEEATVMKELGPTGASSQRLLAAQRAVTEVSDSLAKLSPAELDAPSCYAAKGSSLAAKFRAAPASGCHPLVRPNYGYFNKALPRSTPQVVIITPITRCFNTADKYNNEANSPSPAGCRANRALVETMDKEALRAWVR